MALWWSAQMSIQVTVRGLGGRTYLDKADWIYHADPQISTSMSLIYAISWFTIVALERWKVEKISRFDSQCDLYWHVDLAFEIWSCSGLRHRASIFHGQSVHWREGVDRRAWTRTLQIVLWCFCKARRETLQRYDLDDLIAQTMRCHEFRKPQLRILLEGMRPRTCMAIDGWCSIRFFFHPAMRLWTDV